MNSIALDPSIVDFLKTRIAHFTKLDKEAIGRRTGFRVTGAAVRHGRSVRRPGLCRSAPRRGDPNSTAGFGSVSVTGSGNQNRGLKGQQRQSAGSPHRRSRMRPPAFTARGLPRKRMAAND